MINMPLEKTRGAAALLALVVALLFSVTWLIWGITKAGWQAEKWSANGVWAEQAAEAAEAGAEFGLVYLLKNSSSIVVDANNDGYLDAYANSSTTNVALTNGATYTITYSNPTANDLSVILLKSVGKSADGVASREVRQLLKYSSVMTTYSSSGLAAKGNISMAGNSSVTNTSNNVTLMTGGIVTLNGGSETIISSGVASTSSSFKSDVSQNNSSWVSASAEAFFQQFFGTSSTSIKAASNYYYSKSTNTNYDSTLNGLQGVSIWLDQSNGTTATIDSTTVIGSASKPVLLVVNGNLTIQGNAIVYGYIYVTGSLQTAGNSTIQGAIVAGGNTVDSGNFSLTYNTSVLNKVKQLTGQYTKIPNSWNDLQK